MTEQQLNNVMALLAYQDTRSNALTEEELGDLTDAVSREITKVQISNLLTKCNTSYKSNASEEELEDFYNKEWSIEYDGSKISIPNEAVVFNAFVAALDDIAEELL